MAATENRDALLSEFCDLSDGGDISGRDVFAELVVRGAQQLETDLQYVEQLRDTATQGEDYCESRQIREFCEIIEETPAYIDRVYTKIVSSEERRPRGQFFTPDSVAEFMTSLVPDGSVTLDPAVGTGIFAEYGTGGESPHEMVLNDIDPLMLCATELRLAVRGVTPDEFELLNRDYLAEEFTEEVDAVVCNPPYNKFQNHDSAPAVEELAQSVGVSMSGFSNIYPMFLMKSISELPDGRIVFITPSEYLDTGYGAEFKRFLLDNADVRAIISLDWDAEIFSEALTTAAITIADTGGTTDEVSFIRSERAADLDLISEAFPDLPEGIPARVQDRDELDPTEKWSRYFESAVDTEFLDATVPLEEIAEVKRGIATGHNEFFTLTASEVEEWDIEAEFLRPVVSKAAQAPNFTFGDDDFERNMESGKPMYLLYVTSDPSENVERYLEHGEEHYEAHERYLTSHRDPWYKPETRDPAPILATVFSRENMRFVHNEYGALNLAAFHCVYTEFDDERRIKALLGYLNSNHALQLSKLQKRRYADGLDKFEPGDLSQIPVLDIRLLSDSETDTLARAFERLDEADREDTETSKEAVEDELNDLVVELLEAHRAVKSKEKITNW